MKPKPQRDVFLLYRNNCDDYYVHYHELICVAASREAAVRRYIKEVADYKEKPQLDPLDDDVAGDWYTIEECPIEGEGK